ncbi:MAG: HAD family hydrolase [Pseudomonadota bacterium]
MTAISLLTLDLDNTLWDVERIIVKADADMYSWLDQQYPAWRALGLVGFNAIRQQVLAERSDIAHDFTALRLAMLEQLLLATGYDNERAKAGATEAFEVFYAGRNRVVLFDGVADTLTHLAERFPLYALSNGNADLQRAGIAPWFKAHFSAASVGQAKPHPRMFEQALAKAGIHAQQAVHIGDHPGEDIAAAQAVGLRSVWVNLTNAEWPLSRRPDAEIRHFSELPQALNILIENPEASSRCYLKGLLQR